ncbi:hypothetical protein BsWGS_06040 [Bradybaena similaris]
MLVVITKVLLSVFVLYACLHVAPAEGKRLVCYYPNWAQYRPELGKYWVENIDPFSCTHLIFAFAQLSGTSVVAYEANDDQNPWMWRAMTSLRNSNPNLRTLLAIGGYTHGTKRFSDLSASPSSRAQFIKDVIILLRYWRFDGLDLDWEYPADDMPEDRENLSVLIKELRLAFDKEASIYNNERLLLAAAVPAGIERVRKGYDLRSIDPYIDFYNVMTYDYHGLWENTTNAASPTNAPDGDPLCLTATLNYYLENGASREKINVGLSLFGRSWTLSRSGDTAIGSPAIAGGAAGPYTLTPGILSYYEVCTLLKNGYTARFDPLAQVMYAFRGNQWVTYESRVTLELKVDYILENGFGGAMVWSLDHDDFLGRFCNQGSYPLISYISSRVINAPNSVASSTTMASTSTATSTVTSTTTTTASTSTASTSTASTSTASPSTTSTATSIQPTSSTTTTDVPADGGEFRCPASEGKHPDTNNPDCSTYYVCMRHVPRRLSCPVLRSASTKRWSQLLFSASTKRCVESNNGQCPV